MIAKDFQSGQLRITRILHVNVTIIAAAGIP